MPEVVFGRDAELNRLDQWLEGLTDRPSALAVTGAAGAGKTTLFDVAVQRARGWELQVLEARPSQSELPLAFAGLADLVDPWLGAAEALPAPQRRALNVALLLEEAPSYTPEPRLIATAFRSVLTTLAATQPVLVAIDDVQWLDAPSAGVVAFALRRIEHEPIGVLATQRAAGIPLDLARARMPAEQLALGGLTLGALHRTLRTQLDVSFSHPTLRRIESESDGNPLIALELGRALKRRGISRIGSVRLPVPDTLAGLVDERLEELPEAVLEVLRLVAAMTDPTIGDVLTAGADGADLDAAVASGVLRCEGQALRFSHPLLASAVVAATPPAAGRRLHRHLAAASVRPEQRARHLALAADGPSAATADELAGAAAAAASRGAPGTAAELFELAAALTPPDHPDEARRRRLQSGRALAQAGETRAAIEVFEEVIASSPPGPDRADALAQLGWYREDDFEASTRVLEQALEETGPDHVRRAEVHLFLSDIWAIRGDVPRAREQTRRALEEARQGWDRPLLASAIAQAFWFDWMCGEQVDEQLLAQAVELEAAASDSRLRSPPSHITGLYCMSLGRLDDARQAFRRALARAEADGEEYWRADTLLRLASVATLAGQLDEAEELVANGLEIAEQLDLHQIQSALLNGSGHVALLRGRPEQARRLAEQGLLHSRRSGDEVYGLCNEALLGLVDLTIGDYPAAAARLAPLVDRLPAIGRRPNTQYIAADALEALAGAGRADRAREVLAAVRPRGHDPVAAMLEARSLGQIAAAEADVDAALAHLETAMALQEQIPIPIQRGRSLLALGAVLRRRKQRRAARERLTEAIAIFEAVGSPLWVERAGAELARVSGRAPGSDELTATEQRVADLVARGLTNREVAAELVVTVRAVESTLTKVYAKLGVRSRTQLTALLRAPVDH